DLISRGAGVIVTSGIASALGTRKASETIPLVFLAGDDPVKFGLVTSLSHPGGNSTGVAWLTSEIFTKRLDIGRELARKADLIGVLVNPNSPEVQPQVEEIETAARTLGQRLHFARIGSDPDFDAGFAALTERGAGALIVTNDPFFNSRRERIIAL